MGRRLTHAVASTTCSRFHNPEKYRIVLFDQRGCGKSTPHACLEENTTWDLIKDMEQLRVHLGIDKWQVFGGSWGSTLGLAYAVTHPDRVTELVLRGIFTLRKKELDFFYQEGASFMYPDAWDQYLDHIPEDEVRACCPSLTQATAACRFPHCVDLFQRDNLMAAYHKRLTSDDPETRQAAAKCWSIWEGSTSKLVADPSYSKKYAGDEFALAFARIECHYFMNGAGRSAMVRGVYTPPTNTPCRHQVASSSTTGGCLTTWTRSATSLATLCRWELCSWWVFAAPIVTRLVRRGRVATTWCVRCTRLGSCTSAGRRQSST